MKLKKVLRWITKDSKRVRAAKTLRGMARRKSKLGAPRLVRAAEQIVQGDYREARLNIEKFELVAQKLSKDETATLQDVKAGLEDSAARLLVTKFVKTIIGAGLKIALSALLSLTRRGPHIYLNGSHSRINRRTSSGIGHRAAKAFVFGEGGAPAV